MELSQCFWEEAGPLLSPHAGALVPRPGARLAASWLRSEGARQQVDAFVEGTISGARVQRLQQRVWLSLTVRVLEARSGRIVWSRRMVATAPAPSTTPPAAAWNEAARVVAREFAHALSPDP